MTLRKPLEKPLSRNGDENDHELNLLVRVINLRRLNRLRSGGPFLPASSSILIKRPEPFGNKHLRAFSLLAILTPR